MPSANVVQTSVSGGQQNALALQGDGVFLPKLSTATRTALTLGTSDKGFLAYDTTDNNVYIWNGAAWESIPASGDSSNTQVIFNDNGILAGDAGLTYDKATDSLGIGITPPSGNNAGLGVGTLGASRQLQLSMFGSYARLREWDAANTVALVTNINVDNVIDNNAIPSWKAQLGAGLDVFRVQRAAAGSSTFATLAAVNPSGDINLIGNLVPTNGKGIDFSATPQPAGASSELLNDYEEGTWTPVVTAGTGTLTSVTGQAGAYTKVGRMVIATCFFTVATNGTGGSFISVAGLPFANGNLSNIGVGRVDATTGELFQGKLNPAATAVNLWKYDNSYPASDGAQFPMTIVYYI